MSQYLLKYQSDNQRQYSQYMQSLHLLDFCITFIQTFLSSFEAYFSISFLSIKFIFSNKQKGS